MIAAAAEFETLPAVWTRRHLLDLESLSAEELNCLLDTADRFKAATDDCRRKISVLTGRTLANLFFENSTRTRNSFSLAARRLGADTVEFSSSGSSTAKGETVIDTAKNIEAMNVDAMVIRHRTPGSPYLLAKSVNCAVVNAGDGPHEHPTQGLLDIVHRCDVLNLLRIQFERQFTRPFPSVREYALLYAMNRERMRKAKSDILIMAPGPINRGVEITPEVADGPHSVILEQVTNGIAVRMAVLWLTMNAPTA